MIKGIKHHLLGRTRPDDVGGQLYDCYNFIDHSRDPQPEIVQQSVWLDGRALHIPVYLDFIYGCRNRLRPQKACLRRFPGRGSICRNKEKGGYRYALPDTSVYGDGLYRLPYPDTYHEAFYRCTGDTAAAILFSDLIIL